ncbi:sigma-70 family RNA polymerase sigma factor [Alloalcanivorax sp. C16-1]|uniref:sigma-70 family RNA polymerase sigma factor n=1 Tax=Alloalcanivorax sp. C16-1 TaxID=3390051 RepID=UPI003970B44D
MDRIDSDAEQRRREQQLQTLFLAGLDGDARQYRRFLDALSGHLRTYLRRRLFDPDREAEDVLQEVLLAVHNARHTYRREQPLTAWVYAIARYKLADHLRARSRRDANNEPLDDQDSLFALDQSEPAQAHRDLHKLLAQLPDRQRLPILHVKLRGLSVKETADLTGLSESAVKIGVHRGLKVLTALLRENR